jgi:tetratricopeptide (TPR) repeat protein
LAGFVTVLIFWVREWRRIRSALKAASPLDLKTPIPALSSPERIEPGVVGIFRQVLLLPQGMIDRLTPAQLEAILFHELCHARRRDNLAAAIHMLGEALFWFYPPVWWIERKLVAEREKACDEEVLRVLREPEAYAQAILNVCKFYKESPIVCVSGVTGSNLRKRIEAIMGQRIVRNLGLGKKVLLAAAATMAVAGPIFLGLMNAPASEAVAPLAQIVVTPQIQDVLNQGKRAFREERYEAAVEYLAQALNLAPNLTDAQVYLANSYARLFERPAATAENRDYAHKAIELFHRVLDREADNLLAITGLAHVYGAINQHERARALYLRYAELNPLTPEPFYSVGVMDWMLVVDNATPLEASEK